MKVLVTIPHFHNAGGSRSYGSTGPESARRAEALSQSILGLHHSMGMRQAFLYCLHNHVPGRGNARLAKVNMATGADVLDIAVCTTGGFHVLDRLDIPRDLFHHQPLKSEPMLLGFGCHEVHKAHIGKYDFHCYLEDDLQISDPLFLSKISWFTGAFGDEVALLPHRYETADDGPLKKLYIDGPVRPDFTAKWQNVEDRRFLEADCLGGGFQFERWPNPHSGCFFLSAAQMARWAQSSCFLDGDTSFAGPLESAASLGIMKTFRIYKPGFTNAGFLELRHLHNRYLGVCVKTS